MPRRSAFMVRLPAHRGQSLVLQYAHDASRVSAGSMAGVQIAAASANQRIPMKEGFP